jgi:hypothetical protein
MAAGVSATTIEQPTLWSSTPGWGIAADLTPPELINSRQLKVLRKLMALGMVALLAVCAGGYYVAMRENSVASADLVSVQDRTLQLQGVGRGYSDVVAIQGSVTQVQTQIALVMGGDVDLVELMDTLHSSLPPTMTIEQEAITISTAGVAGAAGAAPTGGLDTSGLARIGTITMSGTGQSINDLAEYVDLLTAVPGLVDVVPVSNSSAGTITEADTGTTTQYNITIGLTDALLSHRFDVGAG